MISKSTDDRKKTILKAAIEVFSRKGYHGCRIADVAKEAGVAYGLVYHYFKNKDELLQSVFESGWTQFVALVTERARSGSSLEEKVRGVVNAAFETYRRDHRAVKVLILEVGRSPAGGSVNRGTAFGGVIQMAAQMFEEAKERGELRPQFDPLLAGTMLFGAIEMGLTAFLLGLLDRKSDAVIDSAARQVADTFLSGVMVTPPAVETTWKSDKSAPKSRALKRA